MLRHNPLMLDTIVLIATLTGIVFVPEAIAPREVWPAVVGAYCLAALILSSLRARTLPDSELGHLLGSVLCLVWAVTLALDVGQPIKALGISLAAALFAGLAWSAWKASRPGNPQNP